MTTKRSEDTFFILPAYRIPNILLLFIDAITDILHINTSISKIRSKGMKRTCWEMEFAEMELRSLEKFSLATKSFMS